MGDIVEKVSNERYCLKDKIEVLWIDETFGLAKVLFIEEGIERVIGLRLITDKPYKQNTLSLRVLTGGVK